MIYTNLCVFVCSSESILQGEVWCVCALSDGVLWSGRNDECVTGGESLIVDALAVVEKLRVTHPHHFDTLVRVPATFQRIYHSLCVARTISYI